MSHVPGLSRLTKAAIGLAPVTNQSTTYPVQNGQAPPTLGGPPALGANPMLTSAGGLKGVGSFTYPSGGAKLAAGLAPVDAMAGKPVSNQLDTPMDPTNPVRPGPLASPAGPTAMDLPKLAPSLSDHPSVVAPPTGKPSIVSPTTLVEPAPGNPVVGGESASGPAEGPSQFWRDSWPLIGLGGAGLIGGGLLAHHLMNRKRRDKEAAFSDRRFARAYRKVAADQFQAPTTGASTSTPQPITLQPSAPDQLQAPDTMPDGPDAFAGGAPAAPAGVPVTNPSQSMGPAPGPVGTPSTPPPSFPLSQAFPMNPSAGNAPVAQATGLGGDAVTPMRHDGMPGTPSGDRSALWNKAKPYLLAGGIGLGGGALLAHYLRSKDEEEDEKQASTRLDRHRKAAEGPYAGMSSHAVQQFAPLQARRNLDPDESEAVAKGQSRIIPRVFQHYGTPVPEMMSSPGWAGAGAGLLGGAMGAAGGAMIGDAFRGSGAPNQNVGIGALAGGALGAGAMGLMGYFGRKAENEGLVEMMRRMPRGAVKRDLEADPAYQAEMERRMQAANASRQGMLLSALLKNSSWRGPEKPSRPDLAYVGGRYIERLSPQSQVNGKFSAMGRGVTTRVPMEKKAGPGLSSANRSGAPKSWNHPWDYPQAGFPVNHVIAEPGNEFNLENTAECSNCEVLYRKSDLNKSGTCPSCQELVAHQKSQPRKGPAGTVGGPELSRPGGSFPQAQPRNFVGRYFAGERDRLNDEGTDLHPDMVASREYLNSLSEDDLNGHWPSGKALRPNLPRLLGVMAAPGAGMALGGAAGAALGGLASSSAGVPIGAGIGGLLGLGGGLYGAAKLLNGAPGNAAAIRLRAEREAKERGQSKQANPVSTAFSGLLGMRRPTSSDLIGGINKAVSAFSPRAATAPVTQSQARQAPVSRPQAVPAKGQTSYRPAGMLGKKADVLQVKRGDDLSAMGQMARAEMGRRGPALGSGPSVAQQQGLPSTGYDNLRTDKDRMMQQDQAFSQGQRPRDPNLGPPSRESGLAYDKRRMDAQGQTFGAGIFAPPSYTPPAKNPTPYELGEKVRSATPDQLHNMSETSKFDAKLRADTAKRDAQNKAQLQGAQANSYQAYNRQGQPATYNPAMANPMAGPTVGGFMPGRQPAPAGMYSSRGDAASARVGDQGRIDQQRRQERLAKAAPAARANVLSAGQSLFGGIGKGVAGAVQSQMGDVSALGRQAVDFGRKVEAGAVQSQMGDVSALGRQAVDFGRKVEADRNRPRGPMSTADFVRERDALEAQRKSTNQSNTYNHSMAQKRIAMGMGSPRDQATMAGGLKMHDSSGRAYDGVRPNEPPGGWGSQAGQDLRAQRAQVIAARQARRGGQSMSAGSYMQGMRPQQHQQRPQQPQMRQVGPGQSPGNAQLGGGTMANRSAPGQGQPSAGPAPTPQRSAPNLVSQFPLKPQSSTFSMVAAPKGPQPTASSPQPPAKAAGVLINGGSYRGQGQAVIKPVTKPVAGPTQLAAAPKAPLNQPTVRPGGGISMPRSSGVTPITS